MWILLDGAITKHMKIIILKTVLSQALLKIDLKHVELDRVDGKYSKALKQ